MPATIILLIYPLIIKDKFSVAIQVTKQVQKNSFINYVLSE